MSKNEILESYIYYPTAVTDGLMYRFNISRFGLDHGSNTQFEERNYYIHRLDLLDEEDGWEFIGKYKFLYDPKIHMVYFENYNDKMNHLWHGFYVFHSTYKIINIFPSRDGKCGYMRVEKSHNLNANSKVWKGRTYYEFEKEKNKTIFKYINLKTQQLEQYSYTIGRKNKQSNLNQPFKFPKKAKNI